MADIKDEVKAVLADLLTGGVKKAKAKAPKYVLVVDGQVLQSRPTSKKELKRAVIAIQLKRPTASFVFYELGGKISIDLPIAGLDDSDDAGAK